MRKDYKRAVCSRELSWLRFNTRVLEEAEDSRVPLMERFMFRNIYASNLDEFYRTRAGKLLTLSLSDNGMSDSRTGMHPSEQLERINNAVHSEEKRCDRVFSRLEGELEAYGVRRLTYTDRPVGGDEARLGEIFREKILPRLSAKIILPDDERPRLENGRVYVAANLETADGRAVGIVDCGGLSPMTVVSEENGIEYILTDELILHFVHEVFKDWSTPERISLKITRSVFIDEAPAYSEGVDASDKMSEILDNRELLIATRVQFSRAVPPVFRYNLLERLGLDDAELFVQSSPLSPRLIPELYERMRGRRELFFNEHIPCGPQMLRAGERLMDAVRQRDILLSYPYESMEPFLAMLEDAAADPQVSSIKMTLYRLTHDSRVAAALCSAARSGKRVFVCVELRARFSERDNIAYAHMLVNAGCRVIYGLPGYKVHCKLCRIDKVSDGETLRITQIGTGNYNEATARQYTDLSLVTSDSAVADEADIVFEGLEALQPPPETKILMTSPLTLRNRVLALLDMEIAAAAAGENGYFGAKLNGLSDPVILAKLIEASRAGVRIELVVRGICCIVPGIAGLTDNITVRSIVGRYLEHARIYIFGTAGRRNVYISSADLMTRNTVRRVESAVKIKNEHIADRVWDYFCTQLSDGAKARIMQPDGSYVYCDRTGDDSQELFSREAEEKEPVYHQPEDVADYEEIVDGDVADETTAVPKAQRPADEKPAEKKSLWQRIKEFFTRKRQL